MNGVGADTSERGIVRSKGWKQESEDKKSSRKLSFMEEGRDNTGKMKEGRANGPVYSDGYDPCWV